MKQRKNGYLALEPTYCKSQSATKNKLRPLPSHPKSSTSQSLHQPKSKVSSERSHVNDINNNNPIIT
jgi:hypothetical protein